MKNVTMHIMPDYNAVLKLGCSIRMGGNCVGKVKVGWEMYDERFEMNASVPHNCGRARLRLYVPRALQESGSTSSPSLCVGQIPIQWSDEEKKSVDVFVSGGRFLRTLQRCPK